VAQALVPAVFRGFRSPAPIDGEPAGWIHGDPDAVEAANVLGFCGNWPNQTGELRARPSGQMNAAANTTRIH